MRDILSGSIVNSTWWDRSLNEQGLQAMDRWISADADWDEVLRSGRSELQKALELTNVVPSSAETALDIGCGVGRLTQALGEFYGRVVGVDISSELIREASRRSTSSHLEFKLLTSARLQWPARPEFDLAFSCEVLYLLPPSLFQVYVNDVFELLRPGGRFVFQMNLNAISFRTHAARHLRRTLALCGIRHWNGWPTRLPRRYAYREPGVIDQLLHAGFRPAACYGRDARQSWFVAYKPQGMA